jgi:pimeloyl-ACP methyl ester carboxylesterase
MTTTSPLPDVGTELREGYAEVGDTNLHYVEAGDGRLIVLLHGFREFWFDASTNCSSCSSPPRHSH